MKAKRFLFSVIALFGAMFVSIDAYAQLEEPTPPQLEEINVESLESGKSYFIKNVGAGQFITGANNWSTQASLTQAGINSDLFGGLSPAIAFYVSDTTGVSTNLAGVQGVSLRLNGTYKLYGNYAERTLTNTYFYRDNEQWGFMDNNSLPRGYIWDITKTENGYYRIQTAEGDPTFPNASSQYAGWDNSLGPIEADPDSGELLDGSVSTLVQFNLTGENENECIDWMFIRADEFLAQKEIYLARVALYEKYLETVEAADMEGIVFDLSHIEVIYNKVDVTVEELSAAIVELKSLLYEIYFKDASLEEPIEITDDCLVNPAFEDGNIDGWISTFIIGQTATYVGFQSSSYTNDDTTLTEKGSAVNDDYDPAFLNQCFQVWSPEAKEPHHLGDGELYQTVYGLPSGMYKLTCDVIAVQRGNYYPNPVDGVKLFVSTDNGKEVYQDVATYNNNPEHFSVTFTCQDGVKATTLGLKTENTTASWFSADNFRLYYYGGIINFKDENIKAICVENWDTNGDGELSYSEAADITSLGNVFKENQTIAYFDELRFFTGLTSINNNAFDNCIQLTSITLPMQISRIGSEAFYRCTSLSSINIPNNVTRIEYCAFFGCRSLTTICIPNSVQNIESLAFCGCCGLTALWVEEGNSRYDSRNNCNAIIETDSNTLIVGCSTTIIPESVTSIGEAAFRESSELLSINIPQSVTSIGDEAFTGCYALSSITIPNSISNIGQTAFGWCHSLKTVKIPNSVKIISEYLFEESNLLTSISIGDSVISIGEKAFAGCGNLSFVKVGMKEPIEISTDVFTNRTNATLYVPSGSKAAYEKADVWKDFNEIVENVGIEVADQTIVVGRSTTMDIKLNNFDTNLVAFQMDFTLPEGVSIDKEGCSLSSRITDEEQKLTIGKLDDNVYRLTSSSLSLTPINGTEGTLLTLMLNASEDSESGQATLSNIRFSTSDSERVTMSDVSFDINILHKFKLTYLLDGEEYMTDSITYKTPLTPEAEPTKDGYTFGGWSEIPETMPANDVEITGRFYLYGDVNTDEEVDVVDVVDIARFVVATPSDMFREKLADLNSDETVNLGDAVVLVNHIAGDQNFVKPMFAPTKYAECEETLRLTQKGKVLSLSLTNGRAYTAFQFDLYVSDESNIDQILLSANRDQKHQLLYNKVSDGHYRVAALSTSNNTIRGNEGELLSFILDDEPCTEATISNIQFFDTKGNAYLFDAIGIDTETALDSVTTINNNEAGAVFDLQGRKLSKIQRGVNIVDGKELIVK